MRTDRKTLLVFRKIPAYLTYSSQKELEKRIQSIKELVDRLSKLEGLITREIRDNVSVGINYEDNETQPQKLTEEDMQKYSSQQVIQMQKQQLKNQDKHLDDIKAITGQIKYEA